MITQDSDRPLARIIYYLIFLPNLYLIYYFFQKIQTAGVNQDLLLEEFKKIRNGFYLGYIFVFLIIGIYLRVKRTPASAEEKSVSNPFISTLIINLIITTFAYTIAKLLSEIFP